MLAATWLAVLVVTSFALPAQQAPELVIRRLTPAVDGDLADWPKGLPTIVLGRNNIVGSSDAWAGNQDASARIQVAWDNNHLYLAGQVFDDQLAQDDVVGRNRVDCLELHLAPDPPAEAAKARAAERSVLRLMPLQGHRPWTWGTGSRSDPEEGRQAATQLGGMVVAARRLQDATYEFEVAIPFHQFPALRPGARQIAFDLLLRDFDPGDGDRSTTLAWAAQDLAGVAPAGRLSLPPPGLMAPAPDPASLLSSELLGDLPYLLVPLSTLLALVLLLRVWGRLRARVPWLRSVLLVAGMTVFALGLSLPSLWVHWRAHGQREQLASRLSNLQVMLGKLEAGSLASYRGASRDRAVIDLVAGKSIARQRYTAYRPLVEIAPDQFGPPLRGFDDLPVRTYWLPLPSGRAESFQFDPPLHGKRLHLVLARPFVPAFSLSAGGREKAKLEVEFDFGTEKRKRRIDLDLPFADAATLGRDFWEACVLPLDLEQDLRAMTLGREGNPDIRLVGVSLEGEEPGRIVPVSLGGPSRDGVLTDLRGPYPQDAGIELAAGATATVTIPEQAESPQRLWLFYRAVYPGLPTANPGARVAEVVLHFADGRARQTLVLEHQVSMFYELAVHNTRDDPPQGSPASIALTWVDESQERHVNLGFPVPDLPTDTALAAIEFRNLADYRIRFRSVVFVNERSAAPQDPPDSPLLREGLERRLDPTALAALQDADIAIYRGGRLSESTLPVDQRQQVQTLPRAVGAAESTETESLSSTGSRRLTLFAPLRGDGWDGAVLAVSTSDAEWTAAVQSANRLGLLLCLISTPFLLVLLSELLAVVTNLRFRLMTVMSVASLLPLGLLSLVLVRVLEGSHASKVEDAVRATVASAMAQLEDQKGRVQASALQWLRDLTALATSKLEGVEPAQLAAAVGPIATEMQKLVAGQLPPEWRGGLMRLEWQPGIDGVTADPVVQLAGDGSQVNVEAPARLEPGLSMQWGRLMLGVRAEQTVRGGVFALTVGRPLDGSLLGALAPGHDLLLTDVRGYPLAASEGRPEAARLLAQAFDPLTMAERERALALGDETRRPVVLRASTRAGEDVVGTDVLRDLQGTPRGLLVVALPDERATLELPIGRIPVRAFFLLAAGSLVVLAAFLSFVVSGRISRPIEQLERGAQALSRGVLDTRVPADEGGQVGRLTRAFNQMAADLQGRLQDLQALNRTMGELAAQHDEATAIEVLRRFCKTHTAADEVVTMMLDDAGAEFVVHAGGDAGERRLPTGELHLAVLLGPFCSRARAAHLSDPWGAALPGCRAVVGLPIRFGGQTRGVVLLGSQSDEPSRVDIELLSTVVAQAASACERARLQRLAVQDPVTGAFAADYFRRRVADEVSLAWHEGSCLALLALVIGERNRSPARLLQFVALLRERLPADAIVGHAGAGRFDIALPGIDRSGAERLRQDIVASWRARTRARPGGAVDSPTAALAVFPADAPSAAFLFEAVRTQLSVGPVRDAVDAESDASLRSAGVTAVSAVMRPVYSTLRRVAPTDLPILLEGETGVGKEVLTNLVHRWSRRAGGPLVKVHCASLSETLLASELFGHERGSFTGADRRKIGRFELAHGGTLFLDEVGEIPMDVQVKLLRALQEGEIDRVGGTEPVAVDVRVIAATNRDMARMVAEGRFREDLYYRLQGMVVRVPPLRERKEELAGLVEHFCREIVAGGHARERRPTTDAMDELYRQDWPGNIRQLRTTVFRAMVLAEGDVVQLADVQAALRGATAGSPADAASPARAGDASGGTSGASEPGRSEPAAAASVDGGDPGATVAAAAGLVPAEPPTAELPEPVVVLPNAASDAPAAAEDAAAGRPAGNGDLPSRLRALLARIEQAGRYSTQDHMAASDLSHRTALRDLQTLVQYGLIERIGTRRGAYYRPSRAAANAPRVGEA